MHHRENAHRTIAEALARELPEAAHLQAIRDACTATSPSSSADSLEKVLETSAFLLLCPEQTVRVARAMGPFLLESVARALSAARAAAPGSLNPAIAAPESSATTKENSIVAAVSPAERAEDVLVAMSRLLPMAPHVLPLALQHWRSSPSPFDCITTLTATAAAASSSPGISGEEDETAASVLLHKRVHKVAEAAYKLLSCAAVSRSIAALWNWSPFFGLCRHRDALVRWRAVGVCSTLLGLDEQGRRRLLEAARALDGGPPSSQDTIRPCQNQEQQKKKKIQGGAAAAAESTATPRSGSPAALVPDGNDADAISKARLDLVDDLRRAPSALVPPPLPPVRERQEESWRSDAAAARFTFRHHPSVADIGGILHAKTAPPPSSSSSSSSREHDRRHGEGGRGVPMLVPTNSARRNLSSLSLALTVDRPILLYGPAGSGKSLLAREASRLISNSGDGVDPEPGASSTALLELHLDDQTDSKSLLGAHACTDVPGEFAWRPGALTRAAAAGTWVLIEDLDRAPFEVLAAIGPLLEGRPLTLPGRTRPLRAAPGFRVFGTVTTVGDGGVVLGGAADFGALWTHVPVEPLSVSETLHVAKARYPGLPPPALKRMLSTMVAAKSGNSGGGGFGFASRSAAGREPGVRDFLKLCARVDTLGVFDRHDEDEVSMSNECGPQGKDVGKEDEDDSHLNDEDGWFCSEAQALPVVVESLDVFAGHLTTKEARAHAAEVVAGLWNVLPSKAVEFATTTRPEFVEADDYLKIGRVTLPKARGGFTASSSFAPTSHALRLMETLAASAQACEPVLLVGETGCGKTALVQRLAEGTGRDLVVQNLSLQTDGADLLGGFRPVELRQLAEEVLREFLRLFPLLFSATQNARFCQAITSAFERRQWSRLSKGLRNAAKMAIDKLDRSRSEPPAEARASDARNPQHKSIKAPRAGAAGGLMSPSGQRRDWDRFSCNAERFERQRAAVEGTFAFSFVEGVLVKAIREGKWVLLDEINLASAETLQRLSGLLEGAEGSLCLTERGDMDPVVRHKDFRLFAAMNPPTDASKKDLPPALRRRFSEVYVPELDDRLDLKQVVDGYISSGVSVDHEGLAFTAVDLYLWARGLSSESLSDGAGQRPRYSLRTLVGAVSCARRLVDRGFSPKRAMVEGYRSLFETQLDGDGRAKILKGILRAFGKGMGSKDLEKPPRRPGGRASSNAPWVRIGPFWLEGGPHDPVDAAELDPTTKQRRFVLTASVESTLRCLARAVASADSPVLLQGPTSAGKTSIVEYLAARLGHRCVRINNHEHTDIQEYTGSYAADGNGKLAFQEGVLVESLRKGNWIILDELNLAPSEVLEALNRLLDHNRELYLSETQETIKPHPNFRLFATQNPPGAYGGRKPLSRAFRNRFMEVHVDDIPGAEWEIILAERCGLPPSHCKLLVKVLHELQAQRQSSRLFLGKHGAISPRDLLRWAGRKPQGKQQLAEEGYMLLAERLRSDEEKAAMRAVLEEQIGVLFDPDCLYGTSPPPSQQHTGEGTPVNAMEAGQDYPLVNHSDLGGFSQLAVIELMLDRGEGLEAGLQGVAMTRHMRRLFRLSGRCLSHLEPLLLVGATGCGKTTVCQLYSMLLRRRMHVVNCHQNTEAADLLGGLRPLRGRDVLVKELRDRAKVFVERCTKAGHDGGDGVEWTGDNLDVVGVMAAVQAAWAKLRQVQSTPGVDGDADVNGAKVPAEAFRRQQKRAYPETDTPDCAVSGKHGLDGVASAGARQADAVTGKAKADAQPSIGGPRRKGGGAKRRKSAADKTSRPKGVSKAHQPPSSSAAAGTKDVGVSPTSGESTEVADNVKDFSDLERELVSLKALAVRTKGLFEWVDGPLVTAMRKGELILLDELSLAEDAVLERLNSVLEPGRSITLAEKGGEGSVGGRGAAETVVAAPGFRVMATMNPGGDFGKRELSPALRSRFTEVWVPALSDREDMEGVVQKAFRFGNNNSAASTDLNNMAGPMLDFAWWFNSTASSSLGGGHGLSLSVRDLLSWASFITSSATSPSPYSRSSKPGLRPWEAYVHGAALVLLDGMGLGAGLSPSSIVRLRQACVKVLKGQIPTCPEQASALAQLDRDGGEVSDKPASLAFEVRAGTSVGMEEAAEETPRFVFGVEPFFTPCGPSKVFGSESAKLDFSVEAPTTSKNLRRVLRALQIRKAVLLEGSPGVGKTSLISALAAATGHELVRINLSEQTDVSDLFGSDLPVPDTDSAEDDGETSARFSWCDGVFLSALKAGKWVLLDELNLATQSVLEGLNACLDHRAEVYIPELGRSFRCPSTFKVFAAQNPLGQGGGRKGLPRSFLSRFTKVYVDPLTPDDLLYIAVNKFPSLAAPPSLSASPSHAAEIAAIDGNSQENEKSPSTPCDAASSMLSRMITFNSLVQHDTMEAGRYGRRGSPWEFNLRDVFRWCELMLLEQQYSGSESDAGGSWQPWLVVDTLYIQRLRTRSDRAAVLDRLKETFPEAFLENSSFSSLVSRCREAGIGTHPMLKVTPEGMQVGQTVLPRGCWGNGTSASYGDADGLRAGITMPLSLRRPLQALARCVAMGWPALVVGHRGSGKSGLLKALASGVGARLTEVAMTPAVDVTELLGCFEQTDARLVQESLVEMLKELADTTCHLMLQVSGDILPEAAAAAGGVWDALHAVRRSYRDAMAPGVDGGPQGNALGFTGQGMVAVDHLFLSLKSAMECIRSYPSVTDSKTAWASEILSLKRRVERAEALASTVRQHAVTDAALPATADCSLDCSGGDAARRKSSPASCFCWSDGLLVQALERGDWIVLEGANLCSASVLDRLNPLLEPGGVLPLTECGTSSGDGTEAASGAASTGHRTIRPHPNFRLFLTADPSCGEVSRAMRNRCVEVSLLDAPPAVAVLPAQSATADVGAEAGEGALPAKAVTEHAADLLSMVRAVGLKDPREATAAVAVHSALVARRCRGSGNDSAGSGPAPRALLRWVELVAASRTRRVFSGGDDGRGDVWLRCLPLAYPRSSPGDGSSPEVKLARTVRTACMAGPLASESEESFSSTHVIDFVAPCGWSEIVEDSVAMQVLQDVKVLEIVLAARGTELSGGADCCLLPLVVDTVVGGLSSTTAAVLSPPFTDLRLEPDDAALLLTVGEAASTSRVSRTLLAQAAVLVARKASWADRHLRVISSDRATRSIVRGSLGFGRGGLVCNVGEAVLAMMAILFDSPAWCQASAMLVEMKSEASAGGGRGGVQGNKISSLRQAAALACNRWSPADPRENPNLFGLLRRLYRGSRTWKPFMLLLGMVDVFLFQRLPILLAERAEVSEAQSRLSSGRDGDAGLGWLGVSWLLCEGGRDASMVGVRGRGGAGSLESRLARSSLGPYLWPLLSAVDVLVERLACTEVAELATSGQEGQDVSDRLLGGVRSVMEARDTLSGLLVAASASRDEGPCADAASTRGPRGELLFAWDPFLVSWPWLQQELEALRTTLGACPTLIGRANVSSAFATLDAVGSRVNAAVLQHAGGAAPARDTLWKHGPRAAAPSFAAGATALARLGRLADEFRILPSTLSVSGNSRVVSLGSLMREAHPSLSVSRDTREELLHALCTLHWVCSNEQVEDDAGVPSHPGVFSNSEGDGGSVSLAARLPELLEVTLKSSRARFEAAHKGTRLGGAVRRDDGLEHHQDDLEFGERFDDFDTEATEAVANATLLVVAGGPGCAGGGGCGCDEGVSHSEGVMQDWAAVQLSPLMEHWIAVEECEILAALAGLDVAAALGCQEMVVGVSPEPRLMARLSRLRLAILATPSLSPAVARPYQTLLWAWDDSSSLPDVLAPLLKRLLPVAMASFGRRLWENVVGFPEELSLQLAPPEMIDGGAEGHREYTPKGSQDTSLFGPVQLLTLARSSFLLRLLSTAVFSGGVVPGGMRNVVDLTLMNASARLGQYRAAMRCVRDLGYGGFGGGGGEHGGSLKPLVQLAWARFCRTLGAFDEVRATGVEEPATFAAALFPAGGDGSVASSPSGGMIEAPLRRALESCPDQRLASQTDTLVLPAARHLLVAMEGLVGRSAKGPTARVEASAGLGMALLGCLKLVLLLPSSPVDPGLKPALKRELLNERLDGFRGELTVRRWSLRLEGGGDVSPEMFPLLEQARSLRDECTRLGLEAIERPDDRPNFHSLFRDVHAFARGLADPARVTALAHSLARCVGGVAGLEEDVGGRRVMAVDRAASLQEETVWQDAAGAFVGRFRSEYGEAYADVVTGICDAVEVTRLGLRVLAAASSSAARVSPTDATPSGKSAPAPLAKLQGMLLSFPYPCCEGLTRVGDGSGEGLGEALRSTLGSGGLDSLGADCGGGVGGGASGAQHMMLLQAVLSRAELLLSSECSAQPALDAAVSAMEGAVDAWSRVEAEESEKRRKEAEILKYRMQEHVVESEEAINLAKLRALFPDYHSGFKDIIAENAPADSGKQDEAAHGAGTAEGALDAHAKALGHMSDKHLSSLVARHCRIFLSLSARRRRSLRGLFSCRVRTSPEMAGFVDGRSCSDAERLVAFRDSYRSSGLLFAPTSKLSSSVVLASPTAADAACPLLHMEEAFAGSHLLALADAARLCKTGRSLLEDAVAGGEPTASKKTPRKGRGDGVAGWLGEGAVRRNLLLVNPLVNFHLDGNVAETRLADGPLASVLRRVAGLLEDFPGHGVLIQLARVADRVRRMPLHSPLAAVLAGVELTLRKAQDWEQHAHRGVSLKDELRSLSSLVVRWRAIELKSWPQLLDAREGAFVLKANRWWLHLHRLLTGEWNEDLQASNPLQLQRDPAAAPGRAPISDDPAALQQVPSGKVIRAPDWPSARGYFPDWLWSGLVSEKGVNVAEESSGGLDATSLDHARGLFQPLDDFLRTSSIGEFFARLQMLRAFAAQLASSSNGATTASCDDFKTCTTRAQALGIVVQGLWQYYSQFSEEVENARSLVRKSIEKKLKEEAKLAKWDEQTYYSLAESSEKSHRKLSKLVSQYDEVLEVSVSEVLHRTLIGGIGERQEGNNPNPMAPCTEIPTLGSMFSVVKKVDTAVDFHDDDDEEERNDLDGSREQCPEDGVDEKTHVAPVKPSKPKRLTSKTTRTAGNSLELLNACLPAPPPNRTASMPGLAAGDTRETPLWLRKALFSTGSGRAAAAAAETGFMTGTSAAGPPLVARLAPLAQRMRSLLLRGVYARGRISSGGGWADGGRPAGFVGAGLAEELCLAVFARIQGLRAKGVGKQVKKRAVLDLLKGMRKQGLSHAKSNTPSQTSDMLHVMALAQPFCEDGLAGFDIAWLFSGDGGTRNAKVNGTDEVAADLLRRSERYYLRGVSEVSRLRLEAGAPVSSDITRREAEMMRGLAENLGLLVLQQRGAATALESDLISFVHEVRAMQSLTTDYGVSFASAADAPAQTTSGEPSAIPPQFTLRLALETQRRGLLRGLEAVREVQLLLKAMAGSDPPVASASSLESRLRRARGEEGWGEAATDAATYAEVKAAVDSLERSLSGMLCAVQRYPPPTTIHGVALEVGEDAAQAATPLLAARAARLVLENRDALRACSADSRELSDRFAGVLPRAMLARVATHLCDVDVSVGSALDGNSAMRSWLFAGDSSSGGDAAIGRKETGGCGDSRQPAGEHASEVGERLTAAVKAMLLLVQSLCPRADKGSADGTGAPSPVTAKDAGNADGEDEEEEEDAWSTGTTLFEAHASAFEQARGLKLWRCASAMASARLALREFAEDEAVRGASAGEAADALVALCREVLVLAEQVLSAGKAVLIGMVALNKGTAKLHYVTVRVFRTLLSKGLCSDESEEGEGEGDGDIDGMKFDDDVEGTGMGEGEGKKDVTDQIQDEEQLLGLKGDEEPDKDQAQEPKELGEDDQDKGMEMENDFEGEMFDVPKGDEKDQDDKEDDGNEKEELDREMGDLGDDADVVDEKLWDENDEDEEEGEDRGEEKFEAGSRLDGERPEDEIRTKEDGQDDGDKGDGNEDDKGKGDDTKEGKKDKEGEDGDGADGQDGKEGEDGDEGEGEAEGEGPVNDDLEDNYEDKPLGVEVRGEDEAMEVDEEGRNVEEEEKDGKGDEEGDDIPDNLNLDNAQEDGGDEEGNEGEGEGEADGKEGDDEDEDEEGKEKEGFESLAPEQEGEEKEGEDLMEDDQQPQGSGNPGPADVEPTEEEKREEDNKDEGDGEEDDAMEEGTRRAEEAEEPPAFGVEGGGGDSSVLEAAKEEGEGKPTEDEKGEDEEGEKEEGQDGGGSAPDGRDDGGGGGHGEEGEGGEWRPDMSGGEGKGEGQGNDKRRRPDAPNPFRDPGDAMRHWHRRLDLLEDKHKEEAAQEGGSEKELGDDAGDKEDDNGGEGKFEYVTSTERGSSQVLGGVSEEQAAEAAHEQSKAQDDGGEDDEDNDKEGTVVEDRDGGDADANDGVEAMDQDHEQDAPRADEEEEGLDKDGSEVIDSSRKSGKRRDKDGHREDVDDGSDPQQGDGNEEEEETSVPGTEKASLDLNSLEEQPPGAGDNANGAIVTNPLAACGDQGEEDGRQPSRGGETRLREELHALAEQLQRVKRDRDGVEGREVSRELWGRLRSVTGALSQRLCEQLRLVLEPMVATKLQGDYRSGKRINMRRVIPYIASGFRKDKIWLRRTKPAKRDYQILMAIDDSESMADCGAGALALAAMTTVASGLAQLEAGQLAVARFGEDLHLLHGFGDPFTEEAGAKIVDGFTFDQKRTNTAHTLEGLVSLLEEARSGFSMSSGGVGSKGTPRQLVLLLSDGRFDRENKDRLRKVVREMNERGQLLVLIVLDKEGDTSILKTREATYVNGKLVLTSYLDKYPFPLYILLNHIEALPETLADALRQWFELLQRQTAR